MESSARKKGALPIKLVAVIEATTVNAVAKNMLEFHRTTREHRQNHPGSPDIETSFVTFSRRGSSAESQQGFVAAAREMGLEVDVIHEIARFDLRVLRALRRIVKLRAPDIIVTHQVKSHFLMKLSGLWRRYPWVAFHHGYTTTDRKVRAYNQLNRWSLPSAAKVITVCEAFARELTGAGVPRERIHVQHNSIRSVRSASPQDVATIKRELGIPNGERLILTVGRLSREKAHIDLLAALQHLNGISPEIKTRLVIVGAGPELGRLRAAAETLGLREQISFVGQVTEVQPYYAAADVLVLPSHSEGSPYVLLEAMAAKVPVVATAVGGVPEMVDHEHSALLVPASDPRALAAAIARVLTETELATKLTTNASTLVATRYSPEFYVESLAEVYRQVLSDAV